MEQCASRWTMVSSLQSRLRGPVRGSSSCTDSAAPRKTLRTRSTSSAETHTVVVFDHRGHGASDKPADRGAYTLDRLRADTLAVVDALGFERFRLLGHSMGGMVARKVVLAAPERVDALIMMDTTAGPIGDYPIELIELAANVAFDDGKDALKELLDFAQVLETPAYEKSLVEVPGYQEFVDRKWADLSEIMWGALAIDIAHQSDDLPALVATLSCPLLILVGEQDEDLLAGIACDGGRDRGLRARRDSRRRALAADRATRRRGSSRSRTSSRRFRHRRTRSGGARRPARSRGVAEPRRRHDVHAVGRSPVRALRRRGADRACGSSTCVTSRPRRSPPKGSRRSRGDWAAPRSRPGRVSPTASAR